MSFVVEQNIPLPEPYKPQVETIYPFKEMKVQDSFMFKEADRVKVSSAANYWAGKLNHRYSVRKTGEKVYRIWRIA